MSQIRQKGHDPLNPFKFCFPFSKEKHCHIVALFVRFSLLLCLVATIPLTLYSALPSQTQWPRFHQFTTARNSTRLCETHGNISGDNDGPTNISHILFGIGASVATWKDRSQYTHSWWQPHTRGFVWLDKEPKNPRSWPETSPPFQVSEDWTRFKYSNSQSAVRIARIVSESFRLCSPGVRWFVMGDDDTVFFADNLVSVLARYDHRQMYYIGGNSESVEQDVKHSYGMAFGGGGFAISYPLAAQLVNVLDGCIDKYDTFYGSDERICACMSEIGVPLTRERGFHQAPRRQCCELKDSGSIKEGTLRVRIRRCKPGETVTTYRD
ncbi:hypothetical protein L1049_011407 [Liquidambar formosana]|uniref:Uncharacterized protein n=1 Tax=Liquidambar formosana TaxID=63359 RepID=A0AAP0RRF0_LIQFO